VSCEEAWFLSQDRAMAAKDLILLLRAPPGDVRAKLRQADPRMGKLLEILQENNSFCFHIRFGNRFIAMLRGLQKTPRFTAEARLRPAAWDSTFPRL
jgi:hypothetical protein